MIWIILFVAGTVIVWTREVDGASVTQTPQLKLLAFTVLLIAFVFPLIVQVIWLIFNFKANKHVL
ncbi:DUF3923 family protein [Priestia aryabhattai]|uniref:DUF3923 family protein n=1 Tax=Priestia aryabhattai TaxID=412384 RepID=UPI003D28D5D9